MGDQAGSVGGRTEALVHALAGGLLLLYVPWAWIIAGFGVGEGDVIGLFMGPMWVATALAAPPARRIWRRGDRRAVLWIAAVAAAGALLQLVVPLVDPAGCPPDCRTMPIWVIPLFLGYHVIGRVGLAVILLLGLDLRVRSLTWVGLAYMLAVTVLLPVGVRPFELLGGGLAELWVVLLGLLVVFALCLIWSASVRWLQASRARDADP